MSWPDSRHARKALWIVLLSASAGLADWAPYAAAQGGGVVIQDVKRVKAGGGGSGSIPPAAPKTSPPQP